MARRDALLRLHKALTTRRDELLKRIGGELSELRRYRAGETGDSADLAFDSGSEEVTSQLAEIETRELMKVERSLQKLKQGTYGTCEGCAKKIPVTRLNALPFSTTCISCQRELELYGEFTSRNRAGSWDKVSDSSAEDREVNLSDLEMDFSK